MAEARYKNIWKFLIESNYGDAANIGSDMRCTICTRILINAHNSVCGCRYCLECVKVYLNGKKRFCPGNTDDCKAEELDIDSNIYPDVAMNYKISKLNVACRYPCGYRCELRNMEEHERMCEKHPIGCPYVNVGCTETRLVTDKINEHLMGENESHTRLPMAFIDRLESEIASMKRDTVELRSEMAEMRLAREIDEARVRETNELVDQIKQEVANLKIENQLTKTENNSLKVEIKKYRTEYLELVIATDQQLMAMRFQEQKQAQEIRLLTERYNRSQDKLGKLEKQTRNEKDALQRNINEVREQHAGALVDVENRVREIKTISEMRNHTDFVWPIIGWAAKIQSAKDGSRERIYSEAFYSHKNGYKMCLSVCPEEYDTIKGIHLAVYLILMRGPFDNILSWPFKHNVKISLIDQHTGIDHVSVTTKFDHYPNHVYWNKPSTERNEGLSSTLIELAELSSNAGLCRDDKLFIRCVVEI